MKKISAYFALAVLLLYMGSCIKQDGPLATHAATYLLSNGSESPAGIYVKITGPDSEKWMWDVDVRDIDGRWEDYKSTATNVGLFFPIPVERLDDKGFCYVDISVSLKDGGEILKRWRGVEVNVLDMTDYGKCVLSAAKGEKVEQYQPGDKIVLQKGDVGSFCLVSGDETEPFGAKIQATVAKSSLYLTTLKKGDVAGKAFFFALAEGEGSIVVKNENNDSEAVFPVKILPGEEGGTEKEKDSFIVETSSLTLQSKTKQFSVMAAPGTSGMFDVEFLMDGKSIMAKHGDGGSWKSIWKEINLSTPAVFDVNAKNIQPGKHSFSVLFYRSETGDAAGEWSGKADIVNPTYLWKDGKGTTVGMNGKLLYTRRDETFKLHVDLGGAVEASVGAKCDNESLTRVSGDSRKTVFGLNGAGKGEHSMTLVITGIEGSKEYVRFGVTCYDVYTCRYEVNGTDVLATVSGPTSAAPCRMDFGIDGQLVGVIPYTKAVKYDDGYYIQNDYEYYYYDSFGTEFCFGAGETLGRKVVWSGWIKTAAKHAQGKLKELKVTRQATRWKETLKGYELEYYTPTPYMQVDIVLSLRKSGAGSSEYIDAIYDKDSMSAFLESYGIKLQTYLGN